MTAVRLAVAAVAMLVLGTGCAAIPKSSPVVPVGPLTSEPQGAGVVGPKDGATPEEIVREFIRLATTPADQHAAARAYLTAAAAKTWLDDTEVAVFVEDNPKVQAAPSDGQGPVQVQVKAGQVGWLDFRGAFISGRAAELSPTPLMTLERENGQWRIGSLRDGLLMSQPSFQASYQPISLKFFDDETRNTLVADPRWIPYGTDEVELGRAVELLLAGPSTAVRDGVYHPLMGATLRTNVTINDRGALVVDLVVDGDLQEDRRQQIGAQVVSSLASIWDKPIQIMVNSVPLLARKPEWTVQDADPFQPQVQAKLDLPVLGVTDAGVLLQINEQRRLASGVQLTFASGSRSTDGEQFALVAAPTPELRQLWIGTLESLQLAPLTAEEMTRPTWRTGSSREVWTVLDGKSGVVVTAPANPAERPRVSKVVLDQLATKGTITELRLSRDGHRVAAVVSDRLCVAVVARASGVPVVVSPQCLDGPGGPLVEDVDWRDTHRVVVAASLAGEPKVYSVSIDGASWQDHGTSKLTGPLAGIAADSSNRVYVSENSPDSRGLWSAALTDRPDWTRVMESYVDPFYPG